MRPIHQTTGTPVSPGTVGVSSVDSLRMAARERTRIERMRPVERLDARAHTAGGIRPAEWWETGLSAAEAVYITRAHVLQGGLND